MIQKGNVTLLQRFPKDYFTADVDRSECLYATSSNALFCTHYVGNVIYHKLSHGDVCYRFNGKSVTIILEYYFNYVHVTIKSTKLLYYQNSLLKYFKSL